MNKLRILVVDDDKDFAESMAEVLEISGHHVEVAYSGEAALERFRNQRFDITFLDVRLPGKNGVESFVEMRTIMPTARVFMMTGYSVPQLLDQAVENGAWGVLHKPLDMVEVEKTLATIHPCGVLIADDDPDFLKSLRDVLFSAGYRVALATDGRQALSLIDSGSVDILILDLRMPILNGLETYLAMKRRGTCLPTIIVTAYSGEEERSISLLQEMDIHGVLRKPFDPEKLIKAIEKISSS